MASSKLPKWLSNAFKFQRTENAEYASLSTASDQEEYADRSSTSSSLPLYSPEKESSEPKSSSFAKWLLLASLIATTLSFLFSLRQQQRVVSDMACVENMSAYSPLREAIEYEWVQFPDDFVPDQYSGYPTQESEDQWAKLWDYGAFNVPIEQLPALNKSSLNGDFRRIPEADGGGVGGLLEGSHQIHCLNLVRQYIYRDHWDYSHIPSFGGGEKIRRHHVDHCISTLLMNIMCISDTTLYLVEKDPTADFGVIERNAPRKCRKFENLVEWVHEHQLFDTPE